MRLAVFSDIHGNAVSFRAMLADSRSAGVDRYVCLGDVALFGPEPVEVVNLLQELSCPVVRGNCDDIVLNVANGGLAGENDPRVEVARWTADRLGPELLAFLDSFPPTVEIALEGGDSLLCFHGSPASYTDRIDPNTAIDEVLDMLRGAEATALAGGHVHRQFVRPLAIGILINPGSVGLPLDPRWFPDEYRNPAYTEYAILDAERGRLSIDLRRIAVSVPEVKQAAASAGMPYPETWTEGWF